MVSVSVMRCTLLRRQMELLPREFPTLVLLSRVCLARCMTGRVANEELC